VISAFVTFAGNWQNPHFEHFTVESGLSSNSITCLLRDKKGFLWIGTDNGLNRYDGYNFVSFRNEITQKNSISNDHVKYIFQDEDGILWLSTWKFLNKLDPQTGIFTIYKYPTNPNSELDCRTNIIEEWNKDTLLVGTNLGPALFCKSSGTYNFFRVVKSDVPERADYVFGLKKIAPQKVLIATFDDVYIANPYTKRSEKVSIQTLKTNKNYSHVTGKITALNENEWLIHTWNSDLLIYNNISNSLKNFFFENSYTDKQYGSGTLATLKEQDQFIFGTNGQGLMITYKDLKLKNKITNNINAPSSLSSDYVTAIIKDEEGIYWIGTDNGLNKYNPINQKLEAISYQFFTPEFSGEDKIFSLFVTHNQNKYLTGVWGAYTINNLTNQEIYLSDFNTKNYKNLFGFLKYVKDSTLCLMREGGFQTFYEMPEVPYLKPIQLKDYIIDKKLGLPSDVRFYNGMYYVIFDEAGLYLVHPENGSVEKLKIKLPDKTELKCERYNFLEPISKNAAFFYLGTAPLGLFKIHLPSLEAQKIDIAIVPKDDVLNIHKICIDSKGNMWLATEFHGVLQFKHDVQKWLQFDHQQSIGNNHIRNLTLIGDSILGIMVYDAAFLYNIKSKAIIKINDFNGYNNKLVPFSMQVLNDKVFFASQNGFLKGYINQLFMPVKGKGVIFTEIFANNKSNWCYSNSTKVNLLYPENSIRISFALLSFYYPTQNKFQYKFEGENHDWINLGSNHELVLHQLPYGKYKIYFKEVNSPNSIAVIDIAVQAPFYLRTWFIITVLLLSILFVYFIYHILMLRRKAVLNTRDTIARDLHDEVGSALTSISYLSEMGKIQSQSNHPTFEKIGETSRNIATLMNDIIWAVNPDKDTALSLIQRINYFIQEHQQLNQINIKFDYSPKLMHHQFNMQQRKSLYLIFKEALNNAFKYSKATQINIKLIKNTNAIILEIEDNGVGFSENQNNGNGLLNMKKRARDASGIIEIISKINSGTLVRVILNHQNW